MNIALSLDLAKTTTDKSFEMGQKTSWQLLFDWE